MTGVPYRNSQPYSTGEILYSGEATPPLLVAVGGVRYDDRVIPGTIEIVDAIEERTTANFAFSSPTGQLEISSRQPVAIRINGLRAFDGVVSIPDGETAGPFGLLEGAPCVDWHYLADRRIVSGGFLDTAAGDIARWVVDQLADDGVSSGTIVDGPAVSEVAFAWVDAATVMDRLAEQVGFTWYIDPSRRLHFHPRETTPAPWILDRIDEFAEDFKVAHGNRELRTRQILRGGKSETDPQTERKIVDGVQTTVVVGFGIARQPEVLEDDVAQQVGVKGIGEEGARWLWARGSAEVTLAEGETPPEAGVEVTVNYRGLFDLVMVATDLAAAAELADIEGFGSGLVDHVATDPEVTTLTQAAERTSAKLARYSRLGRKVEFTTSRPGLRAGQLLTVDLPDRGLGDVQMLIAEVTWRLRPGGPIWDVVAYEGPIEDSWAKWLGRLATQPDLLAFRENVSEEETVIVLEAVTETTGWGSDLDTEVFACDVSHATTDLYNDEVAYNDGRRYPGDADPLLFPTTTDVYNDTVSYRSSRPYAGAIAAGRPTVC